MKKMSFTEWFEENWALPVIVIALFVLISLIGGIWASMILDYKIKNERNRVLLDAVKSGVKIQINEGKDK